jgi:hypothetical protein
MRMFKLGLLCLGMALGPLVAQAQTRVEVGRVKLMLAESGWKAQDVPAEDLGVDQGVSGMIRGKAKVVTLYDGGGEPVATMLVYATWGSNLSLRIQSRCPPNDELYVRDFTKGRNAAPECLKVGGPFDGALMASTALRRFMRAREAGQVDVPAEAYVLIGDFAAGNGAVIEIEALIDARVVGLEAQPAAAVPGPLAPGIAAWGDALGEAARSALRSMSGELRVPPVRLPPAEPPTPN